MDKRKRINERQRQRRAKNIRIDYQKVAPDVLEILDSQTHNAIGGDYSSVLNRIVRDWASGKGMTA